MTFVYPERLLPSNEKVSKLVVCEDCYLCRRSIDKNSMLDEDGNLEILAIQIERLFDYSVNLVNCASHESELKNPKDVLIEVDQVEYTRKAFTGDESMIPSSKEITGKMSEEKGYFLIAFKAVEEIKGAFPFKKGESKPEKEYNFELKCVHKPNLINVSHFEFECWSNVSGTFSRVSPGDLRSGYREKIAHMVRDAIQNLKNPDILVSN